MHSLIHNMIILLTISDKLWLEIMMDLEDLHEYESLRLNLKYRPHLKEEKRALWLSHLEQIN
jgi:hypothetical protein